MTSTSFGRVLIIEDDVEVQEYLSGVLSGAGYMVECAENGSVGLGVLRGQSPPDLVLVDLQMPTMDGFSFLSHVRSRAHTAHVPVIVVSGFRDVSHRVAGLDCGANDYLTKPVDGAELLARVRMHLRVSREAERWRCGSFVDPLTGLLNRRGCDHMLSREIDRAVRMRTTLSVVFIDLDDFKLVNDTLGHRAGDEVLWSVARVLDAHLRSSDFAARWGGDEFVLVLPDADREAAQLVIARVQQACSSLRVRGIPAIAGLSAGIACLYEDVPAGTGFEAARLIDAADRAMYERKHDTGRGGRSHPRRLARGSRPFRVVQGGKRGKAEPVPSEESVDVGWREDDGS